MDGAEIKAMIARAKREDISFAFGRGKTKQDVFLEFDKRKKPDALFRAMKAENKITKGTWGTLAIDGNLAEFSPEKPLAGMARDIRILFKRDRIAIKVAVLGEEDETDEEEVDEPDEAVPSSSSSNDASAAQPWTPGAAKLAEYKNASRGWVITRERVGADIDKLRKKILEDYRGDPEIEAIAQSTRKLDRVLEAMSSDLDAAISALVEASSSADAQKAIGSIRSQVRRFEGFVSGDALIQQLDDNPFVPVSIQKSMLNALKHLTQIFA